MDSGRVFKDSNFIYAYGEREEIFKGMKVIYGMNRYKYGLFNNLPYIVYRIQDVAFGRKKTNGDKDAADSSTQHESSSDYEAADVSDDLVSGDGDGVAQAPPGGSPLASKKISEEIDDEFFKYGFETAGVIDGHSDLPSTNVLDPIGMRPNTYGRRLIVVPIADVDSNGNVKTTANQVIIPWTNNHWFLIKSASAGTIFGNQGGQCEVMIIFIPTFYDKRDTNNLLYVAVTRPTHMVVVISTLDILEKMILNKAPERKTHYADYVCPRLQHFYDHDIMQITNVPPEIQQKLDQDQIMLNTLEGRINEFRKQIKQEKEGEKKAPRDTFAPLTATSSSTEFDDAISARLAKLSNSFLSGASMHLSAKRTVRPDEDMDMKTKECNGLYIPVSNKKKLITPLPTKPTLLPPSKDEMHEFKKRGKKRRINGVPL